MNMATAIKPQSEHDKRLQGPQTIIGRLREYSRVRHDPEVNSFGPSPFARIQEMQGNAGIRGKGIRYDMITTEDDPEVTPCPPDGGLGDLIDRKGRYLAHQMRAQEMATAIHQMPWQYREAIHAMYHVAAREKCRTFDEAARKFGKPRSTYQLILTSAYGWLEAKLCLPADRYPLCQPTDGDTTPCVVRTDCAESG